jgi:hypothetical protein
MTAHVLLAFAPAAAYLLLVTGLLATVRRCPDRVHLAALLVGVAARVLTDGWATPLLAVGAALLLFVLGVFVTSRLVTGVSLFSLCTALALLPLPEGAFGLGVGLALAAGVSVWRTVRALGRARVNLVAFQTMDAFGVASGGIGKPDLGRLPTREDAALAASAATRPQKAMYLPPYLLTGVVAAAAFFASI